MVMVMRFLMDLWFNGELSERLSWTPELKWVDVTMSTENLVTTSLTEIETSKLTSFLQLIPSPSAGCPIESAPTTRTSMCLWRKHNPKKTRWWCSDPQLFEGKYRNGLFNWSLQFRFAFCSYGLTSDWPSALDAFRHKQKRFLPVLRTFTCY